MSIKRIFKGYFIWIANNALLLTGIIGIEEAITVPDIKHSSVYFSNMTEGGY